MIPGDGTVVDGIASVDESAITGESAPVIREPGGDRSAVTGGTRVLSDRIVVEITQEPGQSFLDRMIALVEGAERRKTPNEIALNILLAGLTLIFLLVIVSLKPFAQFANTEISVTTLVALLVARIPVFSTLNIQHLDSLNDQLAELSGIRVRETVPDNALQRADEIVVVDVTPETLLERLRAGKVYPEARIDAALNGFFRIENLTALRETALRQVADEVVTPTRTAVGERVMALVQPHPSAQRIVPRAWRSAQRLGAELDVVWVRPPGSSEDNGLRALRQLASVRPGTGSRACASRCPSG